MGDLIILPPPRRSVVYRRQPATVTSIEGSSRRALNTSLSMVGFDDHLRWTLPEPFLSRYTYHGFTSQPHLVAFADDGRVRVVNVIEVRNRHEPDELTTMLDCWVVAGALLNFEQMPEAWVVFTDGRRYTMQPTETEVASCVEAISVLSEASQGNPISTTKAVELYRTSVTGQTP